MDPGRTIVRGVVEPLMIGHGTRGPGRETELEPEFERRPRFERAPAEAPVGTTS